MATSKRRTRKATSALALPAEVIEQRIYVIRGQRVMLSRHLAALYGVEPRALVQAVKRNIERFPSDFMFQLSAAEFANLKSQNVISSWGGARRALPYAFTEQGVAMLSSVLKSKRAVLVNIGIMRAFVKLRGLIATHQALARKIHELERRSRHHDVQISTILEAIEEILQPSAPPRRRPIGFITAGGKS